MQRIVCYIDILGFGAICSKDHIGALQLLDNYQHVLKNKVTYANLHPADSYADARLRALAHDIAIDSFETFLPFSDNIFITSNTPDKFMRQLSYFLLESFMITGHTFMFPENPDHPEIVTVKDVRLSREGVHVANVQEKWYPLLFRGGLAFGEVCEVQANGITSGELRAIPNLAGPAIVEAVDLESSGKGPRIFCSRAFVDCVEDKRFLVKAPDLDREELLWLAYPLDHSDSIEALFNTASPWFVAAKTCWFAARNNPVVRCHYEDMMSLVIRSLMTVCRLRGRTDEGEAFVAELLSQHRVAQGFLHLG